MGLPSLLTAALFCLFVDVVLAIPKDSCVQQKVCGVYPCFLDRACLTKREVKQVINLSVSLNGSAQNETASFLQHLSIAIEKFIQDRVVGLEPLPITESPKTTHESTTNLHPLPTTEDARGITTISDSESVSTAAEHDSLTTTARSESLPSTTISDRLLSTTEHRNVPTTEDSNLGSTATDFNSSGTTAVPSRSTATVTKVEVLPTIESDRLPATAVSTLPPATTDSDHLPATADSNEPTKLAYSRSPETAKGSDSQNTATDSVPSPRTTDFGRPQTTTDSKLARTTMHSALSLPTTAEIEFKPVPRKTESNAPIATAESEPSAIPTAKETFELGHEVLINSISISAHAGRAVNTHSKDTHANVSSGVSPPIVSQRIRIFFVQGQKQLTIGDSISTLGAILYQERNVIPRNHVPLEELNQLLRKALRRQFPGASIGVNLNEGLSWPKVFPKIGLAIAVVAVLSIFVVGVVYCRQAMCPRKLGKDEEAPEMYWVPSPAEFSGLDPLPGVEDTVN